MLRIQAVCVCVCKSHSVVSDSLWTHGLYSPWNSPGQNTGVGSLSLLQGIFPTQGSNPGLPHCRWVDSLPAESPGKPKKIGVGSRSLLQWIFPTQGLNRGLLHCGRILYQLSQRGSPGSYTIIYYSHLSLKTPLWAGWGKCPAEKSYTAKGLAGLITSRGARHGGWGGETGRVCSAW